MGKYKKVFEPAKGRNRDDIWKQKYWNKWSFGRKCLHVFWVIVTITITIGMCLGAAYLVLIYFGVLGFLQHFRDEILLAFAHWLFD